MTRLRSIDPCGSCGSKHHCRPLDVQVGESALGAPGSTLGEVWERQTPTRGEALDAKSPFSRKPMRVGRIFGRYDSPGRAIPAVIIDAWLY